LRVPQDVSVIGFDDIRLAHMVTPTLTTVAQPFEEIGAAAVETLLQLLSGRSREEVAGTHFLAHRIIPRESVDSPSYDTS
jgi:LacI family transcriptional regulator